MLAAIAQTDTGLLIVTAVGRRARVWDGATATASIVELPIAATRACAIGRLDDVAVIAVADEAVVSVVDLTGVRVCRDILVGPGVSELTLDGATRSLAISSVSRDITVTIEPA